MWMDDDRGDAVLRSVSEQRSASASGTNADTSAAKNVDRNRAGAQACVNESV